MGGLWSGGSYSDASPSDIYLTRYLPDGKLDPQFGKSGVVPDGSVIAAGQFGGDVMLFKITPSGFGTRKFGTGGLTSIDFGADADVASGLVSLADGSLVVLAQSDGNSILARLTGDGRLMTTFGEDGKALPSLAPSTIEAAITVGDLALGSEGRLLVVGSIGYGYPRASRTFVAALNQRGHASRSYGNHGVATFDFGPDMKQSDGSLAAMAKDGSLIVGGEAASTPMTLSFWRSTWAIGSPRSWNRRWKVALA